MSSDLKKEYTKILWLRYQNANRKRKTALLDHFCEVSGFTRKYAIRLMRRPPTHWFKKRPGRKKIYSEHAIYHIRKLWLLMDQPNAKTMKEELPLWLSFYVCSSEVKEEISRISAATIDRKLSPLRAKVRRRLRTGTKRGNLVKHIIPIKPFDYNVAQPGHVEADTVAHCGGSLAGDFIWSLTFTDIYSGWTENRATWGKGSAGVLNSIRDIENLLPFPILSFNSDNGTEFLNYQLIAYFSPEGEKKRTHQLMTRSREYRKNDNCYVEQKNWTHVRELFGYERFNNPDQLQVMNSIYMEEHRLLQNFFHAQMKLKTKHRVGSRYKRTYDKPQTPYQRILSCPNVPQETKDKLTLKFKTLNPFHLRKELQRKMKTFYQVNRPKTEEGSAA